MIMTIKEYSVNKLAYKEPVNQNLLYLENKFFPQNLFKCLKNEYSAHLIGVV